MRRALQALAVKGDVSDADAGLQAACWPWDFACSGRRASKRGARRARVARNGPKRRALPTYLHAKARPGSCFGRHHPLTVFRRLQGRARWLAPARDPAYRAGMRACALLSLGCLGPTASPC